MFISNLVRKDCHRKHKENAGYYTCVDIQKSCAGPPTQGEKEGTKIKQMVSLRRVASLSFNFAP